MAIIRGTAGDDERLTGTAGRDRIYGLEGNDLLLGFGGDTLYGGLGNDTYVLASAKDRVIEFANQGIDTVILDGSESFSFINYTLGNNLENLKLVGLSIGSKLFGNALNNIIEGSHWDNIIDGRGGDDILYGYAGNDTLIGGDNDILVGGTGNDTYILNSPNAKVAGEVYTTGVINDSFDTVIVHNQPVVTLGGFLTPLSGQFNGSVSFEKIVLGNNSKEFKSDLERNDWQEIVGNSLDNKFDLNNVEGNNSYSSKAITIRAGAGKDTVFYNGKHTNVSLYGEDGNDRLQYHADGSYARNFSYKVVLDGGAGNDTLIGRTSLNADVDLIGGAGNDTIFVNGDWTADLMGGIGRRNLDFKYSSIAVEAFGGEGNDTFKHIVSVDAVLNGGNGDDTYKFDIFNPLIGGGSNAATYFNSSTEMTTVSNVIINETRPSDNDTIVFRFCSKESDVYAYPVQAFNSVGFFRAGTDLQMGINPSGYYGGKGASQIITVKNFWAAETGNAFGAGQIDKFLVQTYRYSSEDHFSGTEFFNVPGGVAYEDSYYSGSITAGEVNSLVQQVADLGITSVTESASSEDSLFYARAAFLFGAS
jgi:hypothetical protein